MSYFDTRIRCLEQFMTVLLRILSFINMHYKKTINLFNKLITKFDIQLHYIQVGFQIVSGDQF